MGYHQSNTNVVERKHKDYNVRLLNLTFNMILRNKGVVICQRYEGDVQSYNEFCRDQCCIETS